MGRHRKITFTLRRSRCGSTTNSRDDAASSSFNTGGFVDGHTLGVSCAVGVPPGNQTDGAASTTSSSSILTAGRDGSVLLWQWPPTTTSSSNSTGKEVSKEEVPNQLKPVAQFSDHADWVNDLLPLPTAVNNNSYSTSDASSSSPSSSSFTYLSASSDHTIVLRSAVESKPIATCRLHTGCVKKMCLLGGLGGGAASMMNQQRENIQFASVGADEYCLIHDINNSSDGHMKLVSGVKCGMPLYSLAAACIPHHHHDHHVDGSSSSSSSSADSSNSANHHNNFSHLLYCGAADGTIYLVDPRATKVAGNTSNNQAGGSSSSSSSSNQSSANSSFNNTNNVVGNAGGGSFAGGASAAAASSSSTTRWLPVRGAVLDHILNGNDFASTGGHQDAVRSIITDIGGFDGGKNDFGFSSKRNSSGAEDPQLIANSHYTSFLSAGSDGVVKAWDVRQLRGGPTASFVLHTDAVRCLTAVPGTGGSMFISASRDGSVVATNIATMQSCVLLEQTPYPPLHIGVTSVPSSAAVSSATNGGCDQDEDENGDDDDEDENKRTTKRRTGGGGELSLLISDTSSTVNVYSLSSLMGKSSSSSSSDSPSFYAVGGGSRNRSVEHDEIVSKKKSPPTMTPIRHFVQDLMLGGGSLPASASSVVDDMPSNAYRLRVFPRRRQVPSAAESEWSSAQDAAWRGPGYEPVSGCANAVGDDDDDLTNQLKSEKTDKCDGVPTPLAVLPGTSGVCKCELLQSKKHVLAAQTDGSIDLWDIVALKHLRRYNENIREDTKNTHDNQSTSEITTTKREKVWKFRELADRFNTLFASHVGSWCSISARWGVLCVTLSAEDYHSAALNLWEHAVHENKYETITDDYPSVKPLRLAQMSHVVESRSRRSNRRDKFKNFGESVLRALFRGNLDGRVDKTQDNTNNTFLVNPCTLCKVTVWSTVNHHTESDRSAAVVIPPSSLQGNTTSDDPRIPSWIHGALQGATTATLSKVLIQCYPLPDKNGKTELPALPFRSDSWHYSAARTASLAELTGAVLRDLKINPDTDLPFMREVNLTLESRGLPQVSEEGIAEDASLSPDEYLTFVAADKRTILDPLTSAYAAYVQHRTKGSTQLVLYYRPIVAGLKIRRGWPKK